MIAMYHHKQYCTITSQKKLVPVNLSVFDSHALFSVVYCRMLSRRNQACLLLKQGCKEVASCSESHSLLHHFSWLCYWATCTCLISKKKKKKEKNGKKANCSNNKAAAQGAEPTCRCMSCNNVLQH